jgi:hypothetical protein
MRRGYTKIIVTLEMSHDDFYSPVEVMQTMLSRMIKDGVVGEWDQKEVYTGVVPFSSYRQTQQGSLTVPKKNNIDVAAFVEWRKQP